MLLVRRRFPAFAGGVAQRLAEQAHGAAILPRPAARVTGAGVAKARAHVQQRRRFIRQVRHTRRQLPKGGAEGSQGAGGFLALPRRRAEERPIQFGEPRLGREHVAERRQRRQQCPGVICGRVEAEKPGAEHEGRGREQPPPRAQQPVTL